MGMPAFYEFSLINMAMYLVMVIIMYVMPRLSRQSLIKQVFAKYCGEGKKTQLGLCIIKKNVLIEKYGMLIREKDLIKVYSSLDGEEAVMSVSDITVKEKHVFGSKFLKMDKAFITLEDTKNNFSVATTVEMWDELSKKFKSV